MYSLSAYLSLHPNDFPLHGNSPLKLGVCFHSSANWKKLMLSRSNNLGDVPKACPQNT